MPSYNICTAIELTGDLRPAALRTAVRWLGARHEALRTVFRASGDTLAQHVTRRAADLRVVDLTGVDTAGREAETGRTLHRIAARPFRLDTRPPVEWTLLRLTADRSFLILAAHHIVFDGGSLAVVCRELEDGYAAALAGGPPLRGTGPGLRRKHRGRRAGPGRPARLLAPGAGGAPARTAVFRRSGPASGAPARRSVRYADEDPARTAAFCRQRGATAYMLLLAGLAALVARYTGRPDVVIGSPVGLREDERQLATVGPLINTLPLRIRLDGDPTFQEVLARAKSALIGALEHRTTPFEDIVDAVAADRSPDLSPSSRCSSPTSAAPRRPRCPVCGPASSRCPARPPRSSSASRPSSHPTDWS
ncbi:condensation domain-containing protein [Streptomyces stramineus]